MSTFIIAQRHRDICCRQAAKCLNNPEPHARSYRNQCTDLPEKFWRFPKNNFHRVNRLYIGAQIRCTLGLEIMYQAIVFYCVRFEYKKKVYLLSLFLKLMKKTNYES